MLQVFYNTFIDKIKSIKEQHNDFNQIKNKNHN